MEPRHSKLILLKLTREQRALLPRFTFANLPRVRKRGLLSGTIQCEDPKLLLESESVTNRKNRPPLSSAPEQSAIAVFGPRYSGLLAQRIQFVGRRHPRYP